MSDSLAELREREARGAARKSSETADRGLTHAEHPVLRMQRQVGNAQVARMLAQRAGAEEDEIQTKRDDSVQRESEGGEEEEEALQMKRDDSIQRESEGGEEEEEALQMKRDDSIQRESEGGEEEEEALQMKRDDSIQRESEGGEDEEEEIQAKHDTGIAQRRAAVGLEGGDLDNDMASTIDSKRGGGSSLDDAVRRRAESAMGTSFAGVRVHQDSAADALSRGMTAKAFTTGQDIFLRGDQNATDVSLMSHELTHVVQQRSMSGHGAQGKMTVGAAGDHYEQEADAVAAEVVRSPAPQSDEQ